MGKHKGIFTYSGNSSFVLLAYTESKQLCVIVRSYRTFIHISLTISAVNLVCKYLNNTLYAQPYVISDMHVQATEGYAKIVCNFRIFSTLKQSLFLRQ